MRAETVPLPSLYGLLESLGFEKRRVKKHHFVFEHAKSDTLVFLPEASSAVPPHHIVAVRKILDERGLLSREDFDRFVQSHSSRQSA